MTGRGPDRPKYYTKACSVCGTTIQVDAPRTLPLCPTHRKNYLASPAGRVLRKRAKAPTILVSGQVQAVPAAAPAPAPPAQRGDRGSFAEAIATITAPNRVGEGFRHGWIGNTGSGKTTSLRALVGHAEALVLIHDDAKLQAQYPGAVCQSISGAPDDARVVVLRGDVFRGITVDPDYVARTALLICRYSSGSPVWVVIDELDRACTPGGQKLASDAIRECLTVGRALGLSLVWSTQQPTRAPTEVIDLCTTIAIGQLGPRALNYLDERLAFDRGMLDVVPTLGRGEFVLYEQGRPWNQRIYQTPAPLPADQPKAAIDEAARASKTGFAQL